LLHTETYNNRQCLHETAKGYDSRSCSKQRRRKASRALCQCPCRTPRAPLHGRSEVAIEALAGLLLGQRRVLLATVDPGHVQDVEIPRVPGNPLQLNAAFRGPRGVFGGHSEVVPHFGCGESTHPPSKYAPPVDARWAMSKPHDARTAKSATLHYSYPGRKTSSWLVGHVVEKTLR
jgi:hypothetical protein